MNNISLKTFRFTFIAFIALFYSCSDYFKKYESDWLVMKFEVDGKNSKDLINYYNFKIDVRRKICYPPTLENETFRLDSECNMDLFKKGNYDYLVIKNHNFYSGTYKIECLDNNCCEIFLKSEHMYFELLYNGDIPFGKSRKCPGKKFQF